MATNLNKLFVFVPTANCAGFKTAHTTTDTKDAYYSKVSFLEETGEIMTHGKVFAINKDAQSTTFRNELDALKTLLGKSSLGEGETDIDDRITAIENLIATSGDSDSVINKVSEMITWFSDVAETETGASLISDVAANKTAIGTEATTGDNAQAATGLYKKIEDAQSAAKNYTDAEIAKLDATATASTTYASVTIAETDGKVTNTGSSITLTTATLAASQDNVNPASLTASTDGILTTGNLDAIKSFVKNTANQSAAAATAGINDSNVNSTGGSYVTVNVQETKGVVQSITVTETDIASAATLSALSTLVGTATDDAGTTTLAARIKALEDDKSHTTVSSGSDTLISASTAADGKTVTIGSTQALQTAVGNANSAMQSLSSGTVNQLTVSNTSTTYTVSAITGTMSAGTDTALTYTNGEENKLATVGNVVAAINAIEVWENFTA